MDRDLFRILRYSFTFAIMIVITILVSFFVIFHTFFVIDKTEAITTGGPTDKNTDLSDEWEVTHVEDTDGTARNYIRNVNAGNDAAASISLFNDNGVATIPLMDSFDDELSFNRITLAICSSNFNTAGGLGPDAGLLLQASPAVMGFINLYDESFIWKNNPSDDGLLANTVEQMRLTEDGDLIVFGDGTIVGVGRFQGFGTHIQNITSDDTAILTDHTFICDATSGDVTVTLMTAASAFDSTNSIGQEFCLKKKDSTANECIFDGDGSENIDGDPTFPLTKKDEVVCVKSDAIQWWSGF